MKCIAEGKTKKIFLVPDSGVVHICSKNDITAGDGAKHDIIAGKAKLSTTTTSNVFRLLRRHGLPVAYNERVNATTFEAPECVMLPYEVVTRREAHGSALKKGQRFNELRVEFFLKTKDRKWRNHDLPCDDPLISFWWSDDQSMVLGIDLLLPNKPLAEQKPFLKLHPDEVFQQRGETCGDYVEEKHLKEMERFSKEAFSVVESAWKRLGQTLADWKIEFGLDRWGRLLIADVIDNDSWRLPEGNGYNDKQSYRDGKEGLNEVTAKYQKVARLTSTLAFLRA